MPEAARARLTGRATKQVEISGPNLPYSPFWWEVWLMVRAVILGAVILGFLGAAAQAASNPDAVAVIIGNRNYQGRVPDVDYAHRDADAIRAYVVDVLGYDEDNIIDLRDATKAQLETTFGNFQLHKVKLWRYIDPAGGSDITIFYSGHGVPGQRDGRGYLLPSNADPDTAELNGYPIDLLYQNLGKLETRSVTVMLDACFSGDSPQGMLIRSASPVFIKSEMPQAAGGLTVLAAATGSQLASWDEEAQHGLFTRHLLDAVYGAGDGNGEITAGEVKAYLDKKMTRAARREFGREQEASLTGDTGLVLAAANGGSFPERQAMPGAPSARLAPSIALEPQDMTMFVGAARVNVRSGPGTEFDKVATLGAGTEVSVTGKVKDRNWDQIALSGGANGYVFGNLLTERAPGGATPAVGTFSQARRPGEAFRDCPFCPEMVALPAGSFYMGSPTSEAGRQDDEGPVHMVSLNRPFAIGRYEVTMGEFSAFVNQTGYSPDGPCYSWDGTEGTWVTDANTTWRTPGYPLGGTQPAVCVSWNDAQAYVQWLSAQTGKPYRLPSEAEWEYAARAGTSTMRFWGDDVDVGCSYANMSDLTAKDVHTSWTTAECRDGYVNTAPVGSYRPNSFGLYDMMGNVFEWTEDCKHQTYDGAPSDGSAWTVGGDCNARVLRGGSWYVTPPTTRSANRVTYSKKHRYDVGFRVALDLQ